MLKTGGKGLLPEAKEKIISKIYYSPQGYVSEKLLYDVIVRHGYGGTISRKDIKGWLKGEIVRQKQHKSVPIPDYCQFRVPQPNHLHQIDLMTMPADRGFKYMFVCIDVYSRYAYAKALRDKTAIAVYTTLLNLYNLGVAARQATISHPLSLLTTPKALQCDAGGEFKNEMVMKLLQMHDVYLKIVPTGDKRKMAIVERFNRTIAGPIFRKQYQVEQERREKIVKTRGRIPNKREEAEEVLCRRWVQDLPAFIEAYNMRTHSTLGCSPYEAITRKVQPMKREPVIHTSPNLKLGSSVRILLPRQRDFRDTDFRFSDEIFEICAVHIEADFRPRMYSVYSNESNQKLPRWFYYEELQVVGYIRLTEDELKFFETMFLPGEWFDQWVLTA